MLLPCQTKFINYINVFWRNCVPAGRTVTWLQQCSENPEFGTTLARRLNQSRASAVPQSNLITIGCLENEDRRPKTKDLEKEDPLENEDLEKEDPLENEDLENEDP